MNALVKLALRDLTRRPFRTAATLVGAALAVFLYASIESLGAGLARTLADDESNRSLIVYRKSRYCPQTSRLPEAFAESIAAVPGVESVMPKRIHMNNCRANLDLVLFLGVDVRRLLASGAIEFESGNRETFESDLGSALVGKGFAARRGIRVGEQFRFGALDVKVAGIVESRDPVENDAIFTHLAYLQRAIDSGETGSVTQFDVSVAPGTDPDGVARAIDSRLAATDTPTETFSRSEFLARATNELGSLVEFARAFGLVCVLVLCVLLANATMLSVAERSREHAVLRAIGYRGEHVGGLVLLEAIALAAIGSTVGAFAAFALTRFTRLSIGIEGVPVVFDSSFPLVLESTALVLAACAVAALAPAIRAGRVPVAHALRGA